MRVKTVEDGIRRLGRVAWLPFIPLKMSNICKINAKNALIVKGITCWIQDMNALLFLYPSSITLSMSTQFIKNLTRQASKTPLRKLALRSLPTAARTSRWLSSFTPDDEMKTGTVKFFDRKKQYGFITVDGNPDDLLFCHVNAVKTIPVEGEQFSALPPRGARVQFKFDVNEEGKPCAKDVTLEGGKCIPPFQGGSYLDQYAKMRKTQFGYEVFDIMDSVTDQGEMETKIVEAFQKAKSSMSRQKEKVEKILAVYDAHE